MNSGYRGTYHMSPVYKNHINPQVSKRKPHINFLNGNTFPISHRECELATDLQLLDVPVCAIFQVQSALSVKINTG